MQIPLQSKRFEFSRFAGLVAEDVPPAVVPGFEHIIVSLRNSYGVYHADTLECIFQSRPLGGVITAIAATETLVAVALEKEDGTFEIKLMQGQAMRYRLANLTEKVIRLATEGTLLYVLLTTCVKIFDVPCALYLTHQKHIELKEPIKEARLLKGKISDISIVTQDLLLLSDIEQCGSVHMYSLNLENSISNVIESTGRLRIMGIENSEVETNLPSWKKVLSENISHSSINNETDTISKSQYSTVSLEPKVTSIFDMSDSDSNISTADPEEESISKKEIVYTKNLEIVMDKTNNLFQAPDITTELFRYTSELKFEDKSGINCISLFRVGEITVIAVAHFSGVISLVDLVTTKLLASLKAATLASKLVVLSTQPNLLYSTHVCGTVNIWNLKTWTHQDSFFHAISVDSMSRLSPNAVASPARGAILATSSTNSISELHYNDGYLHLSRIRQGPLGTISQFIFYENVLLDMLLVSECKKAILPRQTGQLPRGPKELSSDVQAKVECLNLRRSEKNNPYSIQRLRRQKGFADAPLGTCTSLIARQTRHWDWPSIITLHSNQHRATSWSAERCALASTHFDCTSSHPISSDMDFAGYYAVLGLESGGIAVFATSNKKLLGYLSCPTFPLNKLDDQVAEDLAERFRIIATGKTKEEIENIGDSRAPLRAIFQDQKPILQNKTQKNPPIAHSSPVTGLKFFDLDRHLVSVDGSNVLKIWNFRDYKLSRTLAVQLPIKSVISHDCFILGYGNNGAVLLDGVSGCIGRVFRTELEVTKAIFMPLNDSLLLFTKNCCLIYSLITQALLEQVELKSPVLHAELHPIDHSLWVSFASHPNCILEFTDVRSRGQIKHVELPLNVDASELQTSHQASKWIETHCDPVIRNDQLFTELPSLSELEQIKRDEILQKLSVSSFFAASRLMKLVNFDIVDKLSQIPDVSIPKCTKSPFALPDANFNFTEPGLAANEDRLQLAQELNLRERELSGGIHKEIDFRRISEQGENPLFIPSSSILDVDGFSASVDLDSLSCNDFLQECERCNWEAALKNLSSQTDADLVTIINNLHIVPCKNDYALLFVTCMIYNYANHFNAVSVLLKLFLKSNFEHLRNSSDQRLKKVLEILRDLEEEAHDTVESTSAKLCCYSKIFSGNLYK